MKKLDYLLVLPPSKSITKKVDIWKNMVGKKIGKFPGMNSTAHLTVTNYFNKYSFFVEPLIPHLTTLLALLPQMELYIDGFDFFETNDGKRRTIYLKIILDENATKFFDILRDMVNGRQIIPHITIIKDMNIEIFDKVWPMFLNREWKESFTADMLTILRRETYNLKSLYKNIADLKFTGEKLIVKHRYKNRKRRTKPRGSIGNVQMNLFD